MTAKKLTITTLIGTVVGAAAAILLINNENRERVRQSAQEICSKITGKDSSKTNVRPVKKQYDIEEDRMISEGALTSVQYDNKVREMRTHA